MTTWKHATVDTSVPHRRWCMTAKPHLETSGVAHRWWAGMWTTTLSRATVHHGGLWYPCHHAAQGHVCAALVPYLGNICPHQHASHWRRHLRALCGVTALQMRPCVWTEWHGPGQKETGGGHKASQQGQLWAWCSLCPLPRLAFTSIARSYLQLLRN